MSASYALSKRASRLSRANASNGHQYQAPIRELFVNPALGRMRSAGVFVRFDEVYHARGVVPRHHENKATRTCDHVPIRPRIDAWTFMSSVIMKKKIDPIQKETNPGSD